MNISDPTKLTARQIGIAYLCAFAGWGVVALISGSQEYVIMKEAKEHESFLAYMLLPAIRGSITAFLTVPIYFVALKWPFSRKSFFLSVARYIGLAAAFIVCFISIRWLVYPTFDFIHMKWMARSWETLQGLVFGAFADEISLYLLIVLASHALVFYRHSQFQDAKRNNLQRELAELQLQLLQMQLQPHFIFNTLHGITTLMERDVNTARTMLLHLADLLRAAISSQSQDLIQLNQELTFITSYVALEQMRLAHRLKVTFKVDDEVRDALVPHMILQPIVENAILHGAAASRTGGWVNINCRRENGSLLMEVMNSAGTVAVRKSNGLGLKNTRARLQNLFEQDAALEFATKDEIATARIVLPIITAKEAVAP